MPRGKPFPDIEVLILNYMATRTEPLVTACRFETDLPNDLKETGCDVRINRVTGRADMFTDNPLVDVDVYGFSRDVVWETSLFLQNIFMYYLRGSATPDGIVGAVKTSNGPRWLPDVNEALSRCGATYELSAHAV